MTLALTGSIIYRTLSLRENTSLGDKMSSQTLYTGVALIVLGIGGYVVSGRWAWGSRFCDINNDGWQDILVNNGFITSEDTGDL